MNPRLNEGGRRRNRDAKSKSHDRFVIAQPPLADGSIPAFPKPSEWRSHIGQVGRKHQVEEMIIIGHEKTCSGIGGSI